MNIDSTMAETLNFSNFIKAYRNSNSNAADQILASLPSATSTISPNMSSATSSMQNQLLNNCLSKSSDLNASNLVSNIGSNLNQNAGSFFNLESMFSNVNQIAAGTTDEFNLIIIAFLVIFLSVCYEYNQASIPKKNILKTKENKSALRLSSKSSSSSSSS
jgi:hypothetical protein